MTPCEAVQSQVLLRAATLGRVAPFPHQLTVGCCGGLPAIRESSPALLRDSGRAPPLPRQHSIRCCRCPPCYAVGCWVWPSTVTLGWVAPLPHPLTVGCCGGLPTSRESGPALRRDSGRAQPLPHPLTIQCCRVTPCDTVGCLALLSAVTLGRVAPFTHQLTAWCCGGLPAIQESGQALCRD